MGFLSKIFKPVSKVLDKIVPNEIKPALPYLAAFAPMFAPGIMGSSMLSRGLMSGGLNLGSQLAQEGSEGDVNMLSALMAGGIGALTAPGTTGGRTLPDGSGGSYSQVMGGDKLASVGTPSAGEYLRGVSDTGSFADKGLEFLGEGADKLSALNAAGAADPFSTAGLKAAALPFSQATGDLAYADAQRALRDYEDSQNADSGYAEGDQNRGLAVRRAMERGGHEEQTIQDILESLGYEDPDPQPLAYGGRVNAMGGGIMSNQRGLVNQPGGYAGESGIMGLAGPEVVSKMGEKMGEKVSSLSSLITDDEGDVYKPLQYLRKFGEDAFFGGQKNPELPEKFYNKLGDEYIQDMDKIKNKEPDFNSMAETVEAIEETPKEMLVDKLRVTVMPGQSEQRAIIEAMYSDVDGVMPDDRKKEFYELYSPQMYRNGEMDKAEFEFIQTEILDKNINQPIAKKNGGIMNGYNMGGSVLPQGMEMDYRGGGFIPMGSKERADDVPARVSKNEFVMTADAVRAAGGGSVNQGAKRMYELMNNLEARA